MNSPQITGQYLSQEELDNSLDNFMKLYKENETVYFFAYGSLMYNPCFRYSNRTGVKIAGYHRSLCIRSIHYRGTPENPGLVFGLKIGGSCDGFLYKLTGDREDLQKIWAQEMISNAYLPVKITAAYSIHGDVPFPYPVMTFCANIDSEQFISETTEARKVEMIKNARGKNGLNFDYVQKAWAFLSENQLSDSSLQSLMLRLTDADQAIDPNNLEDLGADMETKTAQTAKLPPGENMVLGSNSEFIWI